MSKKDGSIGSARKEKTCAPKERPKKEVGRGKRLDDELFFYKVTMEGTFPFLEETLKNSRMQA